MTTTAFALPARRAAIVAGISDRQLSYWDLKEVIQPKISRILSERRHVRLYGMDEMVALVIAAKLRNKVSLQALRKTVKHLKSRGYDKPLSELRFATAGREIYFQHPDGRWEGSLSPDQIVIHEVIDLDMVRTMIQRAAERSAEDHGRIIKRPGAMGSRPVFAGTRVPVETVREWLDADQPVERILKAYPNLVEADITAAREYAM